MCAFFHHIPSDPVKSSLPLPVIAHASTCSISPPLSVYASPFTTPISSVRSIKPVKFALSQKIHEHCFSAHDSTPLLVFQKLHGSFAAHLRNQAFQFTHAALPGITINDPFQGAVCDFANLMHPVRDACAAWNQVVLCNTAFFPCGYRCASQSLPRGQAKAVDGLQRICRCNEHAVGQICGQFHKMITEIAVLFAVQYLQQRRGRITVRVPLWSLSSSSITIKGLFTFA